MKMRKKVRFSVLALFMPPTSKKLRGIWVWARPSVHLSVMHFVGYKTREPLELETWHFIYSISTKNKRTHIFFSVGSRMAKLYPFFRLGHKNLVNTIASEPLELGFSYLTYGLGSMFRRPALLLSKFREILTKLCPFFNFTIIAMEKACQHGILRTAWARILIFCAWLRINV